MGVGISISTIVTLEENRLKGLLTVLKVPAIRVGVSLDARI